MTKQPRKGYLHNDGVECTEGLAGYWPGGGGDTPCGGLAQPIYSNLRRYSALLTDVCSNWSCTHLGLVVDLRNIQESCADSTSLMQINSTLMPFIVKAYAGLANLCKSRSQRAREKM